MLRVWTMGFNPRPTLLAVCSWVLIFCTSIFLFMKWDCIISWYCYNKWPTNFVDFKQQKMFGGQKFKMGHQGCIPSDGCGRIVISFFQLLETAHIPWLMVQHHCGFYHHILSDPLLSFYESSDYFGPIWILQNNIPF